eukprot:6181608-Pleurochrysis_carterae.AAC.1
MSVEVSFGDLARCREHKGRVIISQIVVETSARRTFPSITMIAVFEFRYISALSCCGVARLLRSPCISCITSRQMHKDRPVTFPATVQTTVFLAF